MVGVCVCCMCVVCWCERECVVRERESGVCVCVV